MFEGRAYFVAHVMGKSRETPFTIHYYAESREQSVERFLKWIDCRQRQLPEVFDKLGVVSIRDWEPDSILEDGELHRGTRREFILWKEGHTRRDPCGVMIYSWKPIRGCPDPLGLI